MTTLELLDKKIGNLESRIQKARNEADSLVSTLASVVKERDEVALAEVIEEFDVTAFGTNNIKWKLTLNNSGEPTLTNNHNHYNHNKFLDELLGKINDKQYFRHSNIRGRHKKSHTRFTILRDVQVYADLCPYDGGYSRIKFMNPDNVGTRLKEMGITTIHKNHIELKFKGNKMSTHLRPIGERVLKSMGL